MRTKVPFLRNAHLIVSAIGVVLVAQNYGVMPGVTLPLMFDFPVDTTDLKHIFRAIMGLYIAMAILWTIGVFKPKLWAAATLTQILFMTGLALGRLISFLIDGTPSPLLIQYFMIEVVAAVWGILAWQHWHAGQK